MFKEALTKLIKKIVLPILKLFLKEIIEFIFVTIKDVVRNYFIKKARAKEEDIQRKTKEAEETEDVDQKKRILSEIELLKREIENLKQYSNELEAIINSTQEKATKEIETKIENPKAVDQIIENEMEEKISIDEKKDYLHLGKPNDDDNLVS